MFRYFLPPLFMSYPFSPLSISYTELEHSITTKRFLGDFLIYDGSN